MFFRLAWRSQLSRKGSVLLSVLAIAVSVFVLLGIEHIRQQAKTSFGNTVSGVDLIVGARTGDINLLLYSIFRLGNPTNNISWDSYQTVINKPSVAWAIPISLGDSHRGFRVMGTSTDYFKHFKYGPKRPLRMAVGQAFSSAYDVVLGADVAQQLGYQTGTQITLSHGLGGTSFSEHKDKPFTIVGILARTGTPVDKTVHVSLQGLEAVHQPGQLSAAQAGQLTPKTITAFMLGLKAKIGVFQLQRQINNYRAEPLLAILPGVSLKQLWNMMALMENTLRLVSGLILVASLLGLSAMLLASIRERTQEINIMRMLGAPPHFIFLLIQVEALFITAAAIALAVLLLPLASYLASSWMGSQFGLNIASWNPSQIEPLPLLAIFASAALISLAPAGAAYARARAFKSA